MNEDKQILGPCSLDVLHTAPEGRSRVVLCHGIRTDGTGTTRPMARALCRRGFHAWASSYPRRLLLQARYTREDASHVVATTRQGDHAVGHSRGCLVIARAMEMGRTFGRVVLFAPALDADWRFPEDRFVQMLVIYNYGDRAVRLGRRLPFHPFGHLGAVGPGSRQAKVVGYECDERSWFGLNHSHYFRPDQLDLWAARVARFLDHGEIPAQRVPDRPGLNPFGPPLWPTGAPA